MSATVKSAVTNQKFIAFSIGFIILVILIIVNDDGFIRVIDDANLLFHEAGHLIFGVFGNTMGLYGGTLGQLVIPVICAIAFLIWKSYVSVAVALLWFFENFFNIAMYVADARARVLPLVGGGKHDWTTILSGLGALQHDTTIASALRVAGWAGLSLTFLWIAFLWWHDSRAYRKRQS